MKNFFKVIVSIFALFGAAVGTLAVFDKIKNKNRIKGDYLECETTENEEIQE